MLFAFVMALLVFIMSFLGSSWGPALARPLRLWGRRIQIGAAIIVLLVGAALVYTSVVSPEFFDRLMLDMGHDAAGHGEEHGAGEASGPIDRTIEVTMLDGRYEPSEFRVKAGETVRFVFHNRGTQIHEPGLGDEAEHNRHEKQMQELGRRMHHDEDTGHPVEPGQTTELVRTFKAGEQLAFGCHFPGHYQAGERAPIIVE